VKLKFISKSPLFEYHSASLDCYPGDIKDILDDEAKRLLKDFPDNFEEISKAEWEKTQKEKVQNEEKEEKKILSKVKERTKSRG
jgi:hypothetical protein